MPYEKLTDLPDSVRNNLPKHAREIYKENLAHMGDVPGVASLIRCVLREPSCLDK